MQPLEIFIQYVKKFILSQLGTIKMAIFFNKHIFMKLNCVYIALNSLCNENYEIYNWFNNISKVIHLSLLSNLIVGPRDSKHVVL